MDFANLEEQQNMLDICCKFYAVFTPLEAEVLYNLSQLPDMMFEGSYSDFSVSLGRGRNLSGTISNIRRALTHLKDEGWIEVKFNEKGSRVEELRVKDDFMEKLDSVSCDIDSIRFMPIKKVEEIDG